MSFNPNRRRSYRRKVCAFCQNKELKIDYKNVDMMRKYIAESGKIEPMRLTGTCSKHQRRLSKEIKRARQMALIPFVGE
ncbi:MAG: 30S ribosomal protein S18 [Candidatus Cloacimonas sp.]|nr:30S ribosomal protein S18 [Candidatus Cloacimonadota bacterium]